MATQNKYLEMAHSGDPPPNLRDFHLNSSLFKALVLRTPPALLRIGFPLTQFMSTSLEHSFVVRL